MEQPNQTGNGGRELDLESSQQHQALELDDTRPTPEQTAQPEFARSTRELEPAPDEPIPEVNRGPDLAAKRSAKREAQLENEVEHLRSQYQRPVYETQIANELSVAKLLYVLIAIGVIGGAAYWYCRYQAQDRHHAFYLATRGIRDVVMKTRAVPNVEDVRTVVMAMADKAQVQVDRDQIRVVVEPLNPESPYFARMDPEAQMQAPAYKAKWIVGFWAEARAKYGFYSKTGAVDRYFYLHDFQGSGGSAPSEAASGDINNQVRKRAEKAMRRGTW